MNIFIIILCTIFYIIGFFISWYQILHTWSWWMFFPPMFFAAFCWCLLSWIAVLLNYFNIDEKLGIRV